MRFFFFAWNRYLKSDGEALLIGKVVPTGGDIVAVTLGEMLSFLGKFCTDENSWFDGFRTRFVAAVNKGSGLLKVGPCGLCIDTERLLEWFNGFDEFYSAVDIS